MFEKLAQIEKSYEELTEQISQPEFMSDMSVYAKLMKQHRSLGEIVGKYREVRKMTEDLQGAKDLADMADDDEMREMAAIEIAEIEEKLPAAEEELKTLLLPKDPNDEKNVILEIRAGTGGDEAALFAADLYRMYTRYIERHGGWRIEVMTHSDGTLGGLKEVIFKVLGDGAFGAMRWESGVHRVQRVPATEAAGRIHTSAATVAVLPEAEEVDVSIDDKDLRIDVYRASGPGGQGVNTTDSAVRITHMPTGIVVSQQDQRSQIQNKAKAMEVLRSRILDLRLSLIQADRARMRKTQVGTGDRSAKIRTYNYPQSRVTDHRINLTMHDISRVMDGDLLKLIDALKMADTEEKLSGDSGPF